VAERGERLRRLASILRTAIPGEPPELLDELERWRDSLRALDAAAQRVPHARLQRLCEHHAALWQLFGQWLDAPQASAGHAERQFCDMAERTRLLWRAGRDEEGRPRGLGSAERPRAAAVTRR
jgi:hypothetical protein